MNIKVNNFKIKLILVFGLVFFNFFTNCNKFYKNCPEDAELTDIEIDGITYIKNNRNFNYSPFQIEKNDTLRFKIFYKYKTIASNFTFSSNLYATEPCMPFNFESDSIQITTLLDYNDTIKANSGINNQFRILRAVKDSSNYYVSNYKFFKISKNNLNIMRGNEHNSESLYLISSPKSDSAKFKINLFFFSENKNFEVVTPTIYYK